MKNTTYIHYPNFAIGNMPLSCLVVLGVICVLTKDGKQKCELSNSELELRIGITKNTASAAIKELEKQGLIKIEKGYTSNGGQIRIISLLTDSKKFCEEEQDTKEEEQTQQNEEKLSQNSTDLPSQNLGDLNSGIPKIGKRVSQKMGDPSPKNCETPSQNLGDLYIYEEGRSKVDIKVDLKGRSIKKEISKEKNENPQTQKTGFSENQENSESMFLPQDLLPEELKQSESLETKTETPSNKHADPLNIAINTLNSINTHPQALTPVKTKSERYEGISQKTTRKRKVKNPEFDELGNRIFYVKDNPPTLEQTEVFMQEKVQNFVQSLQKEGKLKNTDDLGFLQNLVISEIAFKCFNYFEGSKWIRKNGDFIKDWRLTCFNWIEKELTSCWRDWVKQSHYISSRPKQNNQGNTGRTFGQSMQDTYSTAAGLFNVLKQRRNNQQLQYQGEDFQLEPMNLKENKI